VTQNRRRERAVFAIGDNTVKHKVTLIRGDVPAEVTAERLIQTANQQKKESKCT